LPAREDTSDETNASAHIHRLSVPPTMRAQACTPSHLPHIVLGSRPPTIDNLNSHITPGLDWLMQLHVPYLMLLVMLLLLKSRSVQSILGPKDPERGNAASCCPAAVHNNPNSAEGLPRRTANLNERDGSRRVVADGRWLIGALVHALPPTQTYHDDGGGRKETIHSSQAKKA
jgi:hypothetical protein